MKIFSKLYQYIRAWSEKSNAHYYLAGLSFIEAIFFPIPPDVLLAPMVLFKPEKAWRYAWITTIASILGGIVGYACGYLAFEPIVRPILEWANAMETYAKAHAWFSEYGFWTMILVGFTPIPFKIFTIAAGVSKMQFGIYVISCAIGRGLRFFSVAGLVRLGGKRIEPLVERYLDYVGWFILVLVSVFLLAGCKAPLQKNHAEQHHAAPVSTLELKIPQNHRVAKGETLYLIAARYELDYRMLAKLNHLSSPFRVYPDQVIELQPKPKKTAASHVEHQPEKSSKKIKSAATDEAIEDDLPKVNKDGWIWPTSGQKLGSNKQGLDIGGNAGDPVVAVKSGYVVYSGSGLRGYGQLIIIKHDQAFLSVYAHNQKLLVKEGDMVKVGQRIAEKGSSGTDRVKLHFEIRKNGGSVDPMKFLPTRGRG